MDEAERKQGPDSSTLCTVGYVHANLIAVAVLATALVFVLGGHSAVWGRDAWSVLDGMLESGLFYLALAVAVVVHELLHALGFRYFGGAPWTSIRMGVQWRTLTPFARALIPVTARSYRWTAALPGLALGALPAVAGVLLDAPVASGFGALMLAGAGGDAAILWAMRRAPATALVLDCETALGCMVVAPSADPPFGESPSASLAR